MTRCRCAIAGTPPPRFHLRMRKLLKAAGRILLILAVLAGLSAWLCVTKVDRSPFEAADYARETAELLATLSADPDRGAHSGEIQAGFGRARLTPNLGAASDNPNTGDFTALPLAGYGNRQGEPATGVHDELWVKAVALAVAGQTGVVVSADLLIVPRDITELASSAIRSQCGLERGQLYFGATHTHCSLGGWGEGFVAEAFAGGYRPPVRAWIAQQVAAAVKTALDDLNPAAAGHAAFSAPDFTRNRLMGEEGRVDPTFALLVIRQQDGDRAVMGSYSAHATVLPGSFRECSGDYPGFWQRAMESEPGMTALFLAGPVGSHGPRPPAAGLAGAQEMGETLARRTADALEGLDLTNRLSFRLSSVEVPLPPLQVRVSESIRLRPWLARRLLPVGTHAWLQALRIGEGVWLSTPCDYSGELALDLRQHPPLSGSPVQVTSFNGDYVGYVVPAAYYSKDSYETRTMSFFGPQLPAFFDRTLRALAELALSGPAPSDGTPPPTRP